MRILHVSDIHLKDPVCHTDEDPELHFREELVMHAGAQAEKFGDVDALLVSGDIAYKGHPKEFDAATAWLETLANRVGCNKRRIYVVPGNHDVDRGVYSRLGGARNAAMAISGAGNNDAREKELNTQLGLDDCAENMFAPIHAYNDFAAKYDCQSYPGRLSWKHEIRIDENTVLAMRGLNSTLISGIGDNDSSPGKLYLGARQQNAPRANGTLNLIMAHHPPEWMSDHDDITMRLMGAPNIVLFGHKHIQKIVRDANGAIMFSAGSVNPERHEKGWVPAYNLIDIKVEEGVGRRAAEITVRQFEWQSNPNGFRPKIDPENDEAPFFVHTIKVSGVNSSEEPSQTQGTGGMPQEEQDGDDVPIFSAPNLRDLIYRFWELPSRDRKSILEDLGVELPSDPGLRETMLYRTALVDLAREGKLAALEAEISEKEAKND